MIRRRKKGSKTYSMHQSFEASDRSMALLLSSPVAHGNIPLSPPLALNIGKLKRSHCMHRHYLRNGRRPVRALAPPRGPNQAVLSCARMHQGWGARLLDCRMSPEGAPGPASWSNPALCKQYSLP